MVLECQSTVVKYQYRQIHELERAMGVMEKYGIDPSSEAYLGLYGTRKALLANIGPKQPRTFFQIAKAFGMSPGVITLWEDAESGFFTEARARPGVPPIYHHVSDEVAMAILKKEVTPEMREYLFTPDPYLGE